MSERKWKSPFEDWPKDNQDANLAFTLVAKNERAIEMWKNPHNRSRYVRGSFARQYSSGQPVGGENPIQLENDDHQPNPRDKRDIEPALRFMFNEWPKDQVKGFVLGSNREACDVLTGDPGDGIGEEMLIFTFNEYHELVMHVTSKYVTSVTFNGQKDADRKEFSWIFPRGQRMIRVAAAQVLLFDVVLPKYGINKDDFHQNCKTFLDASEMQLSLMEPLDIDVSTVAEETDSISNPKKPFYLRGRQLGSGSYGDVYEVLRMPYRKILAAKRFKVKKSFKKEAGILKKICETEHINIVQYVEEWRGDYKPLLIMEYVPGGNLEKQIEGGMTFIQIKILAFQMLSALAYLHEKGIVHRDVKPANILCETRKHYKLADFGVSREIAPLLSMQGTAAYMAPEVCEDSPYGYPADLWSLGVVLAECMNGLPRYRVGTSQWEWSEKVVDRFGRYVSECEAEPDKMISGASDLLHLVKDALLQDLTSKRKLAQECLDKYPSLGEGHDEDLDLDAGSGALTPTQGHPNGSFPPAPAGESDDEDDEDEDEEPTSHSNGEGATEEGESSQDSDDDDDGTAKPNDASAGPSRAEDPITAVRAKATSHSGGSDAPSADSSIGEGEPADPAHDSADPESAAKGKLYTPDHAFTSSPSVSDEEENPAASISDEEETPAASISDEEETPAASISDANAKRRRASHSSEEPDENEANVSPSDVRPGSSKHDEKRSRPSASSSESEEE